MYANLHFHPHSWVLRWGWLNGVTGFPAVLKERSFKAITLLVVSLFSDCREKDRRPVLPQSQLLSLKSCAGVRCFVRWNRLLGKSRWNSFIFRQLRLFFAACPPIVLWSGYKEADTTGSWFLLLSMALAFGYSHIWSWRESLRCWRLNGILRGVITHPVKAIGWLFKLKGCLIKSHEVSSVPGLIW